MHNETGSQCRWNLDHHKTFWSSDVFINANLWTCDCLILHAYLLQKNINDLTMLPTRPQRTKIMEKWHKHWDTLSGIWSRMENGTEQWSTCMAIKSWHESRVIFVILWPYLTVQAKSVRKWREKGVSMKQRTTGCNQIRVNYYSSLLWSYWYSFQSAISVTFKHSNAHLNDELSHYRK